MRPRWFLITGYRLLVIILLGLALPFPAYQQAPLVRCGSGTFDPLDCTLENLLDVPVRLFNYLLSLAAIVLLGVIIFAGVRMMWYHMAEMPEEELKNAKMTLSRGIVGFAIVVLIITIINLLLSMLGYTGARL